LIDATDSNVYSTSKNRCNFNYKTENQDENPTIIEFSSEALRSINITISIIDSKTKFNKETKKITHPKLVTHERKKKRMKKNKKIDKIQNDNADILLFKNLITIIFISFDFFKN
jgi:hypothetical protein